MGWLRFWFWFWFIRALGVFWPEEAMRLYRIMLGEPMSKDLKPGEEKP